MRIIFSLDHVSYLLTSDEKSRALKYLKQNFVDVSPCLGMYQYETGEKVEEKSYHFETDKNLFPVQLAAVMDVCHAANQESILLVNDSSEAFLMKLDGTGFESLGTFQELDSSCPVVLSSLNGWTRIGGKTYFIKKG